jgi:hypothetical protein
MGEGARVWGGPARSLKASRRRRGAAGGTHRLSEHAGPTLAAQQAGEQARGRRGEGLTHGPGVKGKR